MVGPPEAADRSPLRRAGIVLVLSSPVTGLLLWALVASLVGEDRLEGPDAWPVVGTALFWLPALFGLIVIAWSATSWPVPDRRAAAGGAVVFGALLAVVGLFQLVGAEPGDADIGGALLLLGGPAIAALGLIGLRRT